MAHKKGVGVSRNGRDSCGKRLGVKKFDGQLVKIGTMIVRQRGTSIHAGLNVGIASDFTLYALAEGRIKFSYARGGKRFVSIVPN
jgi:large subunit ribosomal protein L27